MDRFLFSNFLMSYVGVEQMVGTFRFLYIGKILLRSLYRNVMCLLKRYFEGF